MRLIEALRCIDGVIFLVNKMSGTATLRKTVQHWLCISVQGLKIPTHFPQPIMCTFPPLPSILLVCDIGRPPIMDSYPPCSSLSLAQNKRWLLCTAPLRAALGSGPAGVSADRLVHHPGFVRPWQPGVSTAGFYPQMDKVHLFGLKH